MQKIRKLFLRKLRYQPANQPTNQLLPTAPILMLPFGKKTLSGSLNIQIKIEKENKARFITDFYESFFISSIFFDITVIFDQVLLCGIIFSKNKVLDLKILSLTLFCFRRTTEKLSFRSFCFHKTMVQWYLRLFACKNTERQ